MGVIEALSSILSNSINHQVQLSVIILVMGLLSFFVSGSSIVPLVLPLIKILSTASGLSFSSAFSASQMGLIASSISPLSHGGSAVISGCTDKITRYQLLNSI